MSKKKNKITVGEIQSILDRTEIQRDNTIKLLDKAKSVIREQQIIIDNLKYEKTLKSKIKFRFKKLWNKFKIKK